jgi:hypothetical protein
VLLLYNIIINTTVVRSSFLESKNLPHFASFEQEKDKTFSNGISNSSFFISRRGLLHTRFESASSAVTTATRTTTHTTKEKTTKKNGRRRGSRAPFVYHCAPNQRSAPPHEPARSGGMATPANSE